MAGSFEGFRPIFGEAKLEWQPPPPPAPLHPFVFHVHAPDPGRLRIVVSDFRSHTFDTVRAREVLEDLRDQIGVGGSWSEFVDYLVESLSSNNVKLVMRTLPKLVGPPSAKLVAHKSKGMPLISFSLNRLLDSSASEAMANLSFDLFKAYEKQDRSYMLTQKLAAEQAERATMEHQVDQVKFSNKRKQQKASVSEKGFPSASCVSGLDSISASGAHLSVAERTSTHRDSNASRPGKPVVPTHRRVKVRGAVLKDSEDEDE